ncbi:MAG: GntR family transcriptional regulator [Firmicutes bacterium]|nr:GntR family transcriptional regulator [Bacillota bacterium]
MDIVISNSSPDPLYEQIAKQLKNSILKGELTPGDLLPSIRTLAKELQISVITTKRAYEELEKEGFIESVTGKGSYVAGQSSAIIKEKRLKIVEDKLAEAVSQSKALGIELEELREMLTLLYEEGV